MSENFQQAFFTQEFTGELKGREKVDERKSNNFK